MNPALTRDETLVLDAFLGKSPHGEALRRQIAQAGITREWSGCGFFTHFQLPSDVKPLPLKGRVVYLAEGSIGGELCGFFLFIDDGLVSMLECCAVGDAVIPESARVERVEVWNIPNS